MLEMLRTLWRNLKNRRAEIVNARTTRYDDGVVLVKMMGEM